MISNTFWDFKNHVKNKCRRENAFIILDTENWGGKLHRIFLNVIDKKYTLDLSRHFSCSFVVLNDYIIIQLVLVENNLQSFFSVLSSHIVDNRYNDKPAEMTDMV